MWKTFSLISLFAILLTGSLILFVTDVFAQCGLPGTKPCETKKKVPVKSTVVPKPTSPKRRTVAAKPPSRRSSRRYDANANFSFNSNANTGYEEDVNSSYANVNTAYQAPQNVNVGIVNSRGINVVKPAYPQSAKQVNASGEVRVQVTIDENGYVTSAKAISGHSLLWAAAENAARQSTFNPVRIGDQAVRATGIIVYHFINQ